MYLQMIKHCKIANRLANTISYMTSDGANWNKVKIMVAMNPAQVDI
jgi:hypothetical protein